MDDDFNTGGAVGILFELLTALNRFADAKQLEGAKPDAGAVNDFRKATLVLRELSQILGLFRASPARTSAADDKILSGLMQLLIDLRANRAKVELSPWPTRFAATRRNRRDAGGPARGTGWRVG